MTRDHLQSAAEVVGLGLIVAAAATLGLGLALLAGGAALLVVSWRLS